MADWAPIVIGLLLFILLSPGVLFQLPGNNKRVEFGNFQTNGKAIAIHTLLFFIIFTILILAAGMHIYAGWLSNDFKGPLLFTRLLLLVWFGLVFVLLLLFLLLIICSFRVVDVGFLVPTFGMSWVDWYPAVVILQGKFTCSHFLFFFFGQSQINARFFFNCYE